MAGSDYMSDMYEYLKWEGSHTFDESPFCEVDNVILSMIAYSDLEGVMTQDEELSIEEVSDRYYKIHTEEEIIARDTFYKMAPIVLKNAAESIRFKGTILSKYINFISEDREEQYSALTYELPNGVSYVAFRGTDNTIVGWKEDFNLSFMTSTAGQKRAVEYVDYYFGKSDEPLIFGGHSKGGNFSVYAGAFCKREVQDRIINVYSNDGPGFRDEILESEGYKAILPRVISIIPEESYVGVLLSNSFNDYVVKSSAKGINQHDPMSWKINGTQFVRAERRSESSFLVDRTMMKWLSTMNDKDRSIFTDTIFSTIDNVGVKKLSDVSERGLGLFADFIKSVKEQPAEKQHEMSEAVKNLLKIGSDVVLSDVMEKTRWLSPHSFTKNSIRKEMKKKRSDIPTEELQEKSSIITNKILETKEYQEADIILAYMSTKKEVDVSGVISQAFLDGKKVYIPKVISKTAMQFYFHDGVFTISDFGISEPARADESTMFDCKRECKNNPEVKILMIMPGVAYDMSRNRLGYGGGYYDRYLKEQNGFPVKTLAVGFDFQIVESIPTDAYDKKPDILITEERTL